MERTKMTPESVGSSEDFALIVERKGAFYIRAHWLEDGNILEWNPGANTWSTVQSLSSLLAELKAEKEEAGL